LPIAAPTLQRLLHQAIIITCWRATLAGVRAATGNQLDRDTVAESQIRTVVQQFRDRTLPANA